MNINTDLGFAWVCAIFGAVFLIGVAMLKPLQRETETEHQPVANEVVNNVANNVTTIETEVYRVVCVEEKTGYCGAYSVRRIVKE